MVRPSWDAYFMEIAKKVSVMSDDLHTKVGAVIRENSSSVIKPIGIFGMEEEQLMYIIWKRICIL